MLLLTEQLKLITVLSLFHMSVVIILIGIRLVKLRTKFLLRHNHLGIRALAYPERVEGVQPPFNVFNCVFAHKILYIVQALLLCSLYPILNFVQENVKNCTRTLISHYASEFVSYTDIQVML